MAKKKNYKDNKDDIVSFAVICRPQAGVGMDEMRDNLSLETVQRYSPSAQTKVVVANALMAKGFRVYWQNQSPVVSAEGPKELFENVFRTRLKKHSIKIGGKQGRTVEFFGKAEKADAPDFTVIPLAIHIAIQFPPTFAVSTLPPATPASTLRVPGDVGILMGASATNRLLTPAGQLATGSGIRVGVIDSGFYPHPFYKAHGYRLTPEAYHPGVNPQDDSIVGHGTSVVANVFACAPDAEVLGIKFDKSVIDAVAYAMGRGVHILSFSAYWNYDNPATYSPDDGLAMRMTLLTAISSGITVVATVGNNQGTDLFPALMPEVIAVGGAAVTRQTASPLNPEAWSGGSSFTYDGRPVPDVCGLASNIMLPAEPSISPGGWHVDTGTSFATPQVAGVAALLLQKQPGLSPAAVKNTLQNSAIDITRGQSAMRHTAGAGYDLATGYGLVNALAAWNAL